MIALLAGCSTPNKPPTATSTAAPTDAANISDEEAESCGQRLTLALKDSDAEAVGRLVDYELFLDHITGGLKLDSEVKKGFRKGFLERLSQSPAGLFTATLGQRARILKIHRDQGRTKVLVRVLIGTAPAALTYLDLHLTRNAEGEVVIDDFYSYATGERISETLRRTILPVLASMSKTPLQKLVGGSDVMAENFQEIVRMGQSVQAGQHKQAIDTFNALPEEVKNQKFVLLLYLQATSEQNESLYKDALTRLRTHFPGDPSMKVHEIDYFLLTRELDKVLPAIEALEEGLGTEDPYLNVMRASACMELEDYDKAAEWARTAIKKEPEVEEGYWSLINISMKHKDYKSVVEGLVGLERFYPNLRDEAGEDPDYAEFLKSPEGKKWQAGKGS